MPVQNRGMAWEWVGATATGVVGIAGIGATLWTNSRNRQAQEKSQLEAAVREREAVLEAERKRVYTQLYDALCDFIDFTARVKVELNHAPTNTTPAFLSEAMDSLARIHKSTSELMIFAPKEIVLIAAQIPPSAEKHLMAATSPTSTDRDLWPIREMQIKMLNAMRRDFGQEGDIKARQVEVIYWEPVPPQRSETASTSVCGEADNG